jgi:hypothetical protein
MSSLTHYRYLFIGNGSLLAKQGKVLIAKLPAGNYNLGYLFPRKKRPVPSRNNLLPEKRNELKAPAHF